LKVDIAERANKKFRHIGICVKRTIWFLFLGTFWMYLGFSVVGLVFLCLTLPETKGKNLEEIEGIFAKPWLDPGGKFHPFTKKASQFNYTHMSHQDSSTLANSSTSEGQQTDSTYGIFTRKPRPNILGRGKLDEEVVVTKLCTNRQISTTTDDGESDDETTSNE